MRGNARHDSAGANNPFAARGGSALYCCLSFSARIHAGYFLLEDSPCR